MFVNGSRLHGICGNFQDNLNPTKQSDSPTVMIIPKDGNILVLSGPTYLLGPADETERVSRVSRG